MSKSGQSAFGQREEESVTRKELVTKLAREIRIGARVIEIKEAALAAAAARELRRIVRRHRATRRRQEGSGAARRGLGSPAGSCACEIPAAGTGAATSCVAITS